jgi:hypothetical protein
MSPWNWCFSRPARAAAFRYVKFRSVEARDGLKEGWGAIIGNWVEEFS